MTPGSTGYTVARCGLPVDDGGRPGKLSRRVTTTTERGKRGNRGGDCNRGQKRSACGSGAGGTPLDILRVRTFLSVYWQRLLVDAGGVCPRPGGDVIVVRI